VIPKLAQARVEAARRTYLGLERNFREGRPALVEPVYRWSRRLLDAEREASDQKEAQLAAYQAHLQRMRGLERITRDRFRDRLTIIEEVDATEYYRLEASLWLERARGK
jgi:hypothetical protein